MGWAWGRDIPGDMSDPPALWEQTQGLRDRSVQLEQVPSNLGGSLLGWFAHGYCWCGGQQSLPDPARQGGAGQTCKRGQGSPDALRNVKWMQLLMSPLCI